MICPGCEAENEDWWLYCRGCRHFFDAALDGLPTPEEGERTLELVQACELSLQAYWTPAELAYFLEEFTAEQHRREGSIREVEIPFGLEEDFHDELETGFRGVMQCNQALARMMAVDLELEGRMSLLEALHDFVQGVATVKEAMKINRSSYGRPLWI